MIKPYERVEELTCAVCGNYPSWKEVRYENYGGSYPELRPFCYQCHRDKWTREWNKIQEEKLKNRE